MHMADALVSPVVGGVMLAVSTGTIGYSIKKITQDEMDEKKVPLMGIMGAFVFAAQMINFTIPGTGSSGHIGGGILLAALLGPFPAFLTLSAVLIIQALFFADGGLLALGCNIFNMGFMACFVAYPLIFKPIIKKGFNAKRILTASILTVVVALQLGAFGVVLETLISGITVLPFNTFVLFMQPIHLAIGLVEGIITAGILIFVLKARPEILTGALNNQKLRDVSVKKVATVFIIATVLIGGGLSLFASAYPDGLEWAIEKTAGTSDIENDSEVHQGSGELQEDIAILPDYSFGEEDNGTGTATSGIVGGLMTLVLAGATGFIISKVKKRKRQPEN